MKTKSSEFLYLSDKLDIIDDRLDEMHKLVALQSTTLAVQAKTLEVQEQNLAEHMKRTALLEDAQKPLTKFMYASYGIIAFLTFVAAAYAAVKG